MLGLREKPVEVGGDLGGELCVAHGRAPLTISSLLAVVLAAPGTGRSCHPAETSLALSPLLSTSLRKLLVGWGRPVANGAPLSRGWGHTAPSRESLECWQGAGQGALALPERPGPMSA